MAQTAKNTVSYALGNIKLAPTEEIIGFEIHVTGGGFESISSLPKGWRISIDNRSATETVMNADLSFGTETLSLAALQEVVLKLSQTDVQGHPFKVLGHLLVSHDASERRVSLLRPNFVER